MTTRLHAFDVRDICLRQRQGDPTAVDEFESIVAPSVRRIVKRLLRSNHVPSPRDPGMLSEAQRLLKRTTANSHTVEETIVDCATQHCV